jgi:hypothetical protein
MWFGGDWPGYDRTRIRFYVDEETKPSIDMELFLGHGIGWGDPSAPWGSARLGKSGHPSGLYNTYRIPFGKSIRVTGQLGADVEKPQVFWWIIRGVENLPVFLGNIRLPDNARLRLQVRDDVELEPLQVFDICQSSRAGALYQVTLAVASKNFNFLEAVLRAYMDGAKDPLLLSSGTEDYFLGTYTSTAACTTSLSPASRTKNKMRTALAVFLPTVFMTKIRLSFKRGSGWLGETAKKKMGRLMECHNAAGPRATSGSMNGERLTADRRRMRICRTRHGWLVPRFLVDTNQEERGNSSWIP